MVNNILTEVVNNTYLLSEVVNNILTEVVNNTYLLTEVVNNILAPKWCG